MTDPLAHQAAMVAVADGAGGDALAHQYALVAVCQETPPQAGGALVEQAAMVAVVRDYYIPPIYIPVPCGEFMQTMPYYVGEFQ